MATQKLTRIDPSLPFQFLGVEDTGPADCGRFNGSCPHCGAEGRYIYHWSEYGKHRAAMVFCYKMLTGKVDKDDETQFMEILSRKLAQGKPLNGWQKTVLRMYAFIEQEKYSFEWCRNNIIEAIAASRRYAVTRSR